MTIATDYLFLYLNSQTKENPQLNSAANPVSLNAAATSYFSPSDYYNLGTGLFGTRIPFDVVSTPVDLSSYKYIKIGTCPRGDQTVYWDTFANGGYRILIYDSSNNFIGWNVSGKDRIKFHTSEQYLGFPSSFITTQDPFNYRFIIDLSRTPDYSSGVFDISDSVGIEPHVNFALNVAQSTKWFGAGGIYAFNPEVIIGGTAISPIYISDLKNAVLGISSIYCIYNNLFGENNNLSGIDGNTFSLMYGFAVGDGSTETHFESDGQKLVFTSPAESSDAEFYTMVLLNTSYDRSLYINQSADDIVLFKNGAIVGDANCTINTYDIEVVGNASGSCIFENENIKNAKDVSLAHATAIDTTFDSCTNLHITSDSSITGSFFRNGRAEGFGLVIDDVAGDYSGIDVRFNLNSGKDISLGDGGAGTYDLLGISKATGYKLKIYNNHATNAVVIVIPSAIYSEGEGIGWSTSTAGGSITVTGSPVTSNILIPSIIDGSKYLVFIDETPVGGLKTVSGGAGISEVFTAGTDFTAGDSWEIWIIYTSGATCKADLDISGVFGSTTETITRIETQAACPVYTANGLSGIDYIGDYTIDTVDDEADIDTPANFNNLELFAWLKYIQTTSEAALLDLFGAFGADDVANYYFDHTRKQFYIDNTTATDAVEESGTRWYVKNGTSADPVKRPRTGVGSVDVNWRDRVYTSVVSTSDAVIGGDLDDVADKLQVAMDAQGYTSARAAYIDDIETRASQATADADHDATQTAIGALTAPDNASITAIKAKTDNLPDTPASKSDVINASQL